MDGERAALGASHAEVGGYLLGLWGLPVSLVEAAIYHHRPATCPAKGFAPLSAVHAANVLEHERAADEDPSLRPQLDEQYLAALGMQGREEVWRGAPAEAELCEAP